MTGRCRRCVHCYANSGVHISHLIEGKAHAMPTLPKAPSYTRMGCFRPSVGCSGCLVAVPDVLVATVAAVVLLASCASRGGSRKHCVEAPHRETVPGDTTPTLTAPSMT